MFFIIKWEEYSMHPLIDLFYSQWQREPIMHMIMLCQRTWMDMMGRLESKAKFLCSFVFNRQLSYNKQLELEKGNQVYKI